MKLSGHHYYGMELKPFHNSLINITIDKFLFEIEKIGFNYFIILDRKNRLKKILSSIIAHKNNIWHIKNNQKNKLSKIIIDVNNIKIDFDYKSLILNPPPGFFY